MSWSLRYALALAACEQMRQECALVTEEDYRAVGLVRPLPPPSDVVVESWGSASDAAVKGVAGDFPFLPEAPR